MDEKEDYSAAMEAMSASTASSVVAQLVQKRTALRFSSTFCQKLKE